MMQGARAEGMDEGITQGMTRMAQEAICKYLEARFGEGSRGLQEKVKQHTDLEVLDKIMNLVYKAWSLDEALGIIEGVLDA